MFHCYIVSSSDGPESFTIQPSKPVGVKGKAITLSCSADGHPTPSYEWHLPNDSIDIHAGHSLTLSDIQYGDAGGMYTCLVNNTINAGKMTATEAVELRVEGNQDVI